MGHPSSRPSDDDPVGPLHALELAQIARSYYLDGESKVEIAERHGMSRFRVARLLDEARERGIVKIHIDVPAHVELDLSQRITDRFALERAIVATTTGMARAEERRAVAALAASLIADVVSADDIVGIGGGRTVYDTVAALPPLAPCAAVQLLGGVPGVGMWANSVDVTRVFAERTGGPVYAYLLPYLVEDAAVAERLHRDAQYARASSMFDALSLAITAVGAWTPTPRSGLHDLLDESQQRRLRQQGVVADVLGVLVDAQGAVVASAHSDRSSGIGLEQLRRVPRTIAVCSGVEMATALTGVLRSGLVGHVVCDADLARLLV